MRALIFEFQATAEYEARAGRAYGYDTRVVQCEGGWIVTAAQRFTRGGPRLVVCEDGQIREEGE